MTQEAAILKDLKRGKKITPLQALKKYGCFRLASRISKIQKDFEITIDRKMVKVGQKNKRVMQYFL